MPIYFVDIHVNIYVTPFLGKKIKRTRMETVIVKALSGNLQKEKITMAITCERKN
jgi:hypothetical protein